VNEGWPHCGHPSFTRVKTVPLFLIKPSRKPTRRFGVAPLGGEAGGGGAKRLADGDTPAGGREPPPQAGCPLNARSGRATGLNADDSAGGRQRRRSAAICVITEDSRSTASKCSFGVPIYAGHGRARASTGSATLSSITDV
jgi:hypothetical protein